MNKLRLKIKIKELSVIVLLATSCSSNELKLENYATQSVKFAKQKVNYPNNDFSFYLPKNWSWKVENYKDNNIILGIDAASKADKKGLINLISIQKVKSFGGNKDLKSEFDYLLNLSKKQSKSINIIESGETKIFDQKAYYIHTKSEKNTYGNSEMISFILEGQKIGTFYYLNAGISQTNDLDNNMAIIVQSLKTFKIN